MPPPVMHSTSGIPHHTHRQFCPSASHESSATWCKVYSNSDTPAAPVLAQAAEPAQARAGAGVRVAGKPRSRDKHDAVPAAPVQAQRAEPTQAQAGGGISGRLPDLGQLLARASLLQRWIYLCSDIMRRPQTEFTTLHEQKDTCRGLHSHSS